MGARKVLDSFKQINKLQEEVNRLKNDKIANLDHKIAEKETLDDLIKTLAQLIVEKEDYFSIVKTLDILSAKTGFYISNYSIDQDKLKTEKINLQVSGLGSSQDLLNFLKEYNFGGGRLVTSDNIDYKSDIQGVIKINLTLYNKKRTNSSGQSDASFINQRTQVENLNQIISEIREIRSKIETSTHEHKEDNKDSIGNYEKKEQSF